MARTAPPHRQRTACRRTPGNLVVGPLIGLLGLRHALSLGFVNYTAQALVFGLSTRRHLHFLASPSFFLTPCVCFFFRFPFAQLTGHLAVRLRLNVLSAAMSEHASAVGLSQGQLRGAVTNLGSIVSMVSNMVWPSVPHSPCSSTRWISGLTRRFVGAQARLRCGSAGGQTGGFLPPNRCVGTAAAGDRAAGGRAQQAP